MLPLSIASSLLVVFVLIEFATEEACLLKDTDLAKLLSFSYSFASLANLRLCLLAVPVFDVLLLSPLISLFLLLSILLRVDDDGY